MRIGLLQNWSRSQNTFYSDHESSNKVDVVISKSLADMIVLKHQEKSADLDFSEIIKILSRKNRMKEVGYFAIIFLQSRIRKYLAKRRVRHILLRRFEQVPSTRRKAEFYVDNLRLHKWTRLPHLLKHESPASPRTIERRIAADTKKSEIRMQTFQLAWNRCDSDDLLNREHLMVRLQKQFALFRDLCALAMFRLHKHSSANHMHSFSNSYASLVSSVGTQHSQGEDSFGALSSKFHPVWVSMSAPASPARQLGLAMALAVLPPVISSTTKSMLIKQAAALPETGGSATSPSKPQPTKKSSVVGMNHNRALQQLEAKAWECLRCNTPEEVLAKLMCGELLACVESVLNITQDEHGIWLGQLDFARQDAAKATHTAPSVHDSHSENYLGPKPTVVVPDKPVVAPTAEEVARAAKYDTEVLPLCMQLRPYYADRTPNGLFRLFFYEEEFVAATQVSPWAFYPEVRKQLILGDDCDGIPFCSCSRAETRL